MSPSDSLLLAAGSTVTVVALLHGFLMHSRILRPINAAVSSAGTLSRTAAALVGPLLHASTFVWLVSGAAMIYAAFRMTQPGRLVLLLALCLFCLYGVVVSLWAGRGRHPGGWLMMIGVGLLLLSMAQHP